MVRSMVRAVGKRSAAGPAATSRHEGRPATYRGKAAIHLTAGGGPQDTEPLAVVGGSDLGDGTIEVDAAGAPGRGRV